MIGLNVQSGQQMEEVACIRSGNSLTSFRHGKDVDHLQEPVRGNQCGLGDQTILDPRSFLRWLRPQNTRPS